MTNDSLTMYVYKKEVILDINALVHYTWEYTLRVLHNNSIAHHEGTTPLDDLISLEQEFCKGLRASNTAKYFFDFYNLIPPGFHF